ALPAAGVLRYRLGRRRFDPVVETYIDVVLRLEHWVARAPSRDAKSGGPPQAAPLSRRCFLFDLSVPHLRRCRDLGRRETIVRCPAAAHIRDGSCDCDAGRTRVRSALP